MTRSREENTLIDLDLRLADSRNREIELRNKVDALYVDIAAECNMQVALVAQKQAILKGAEPSGHQEPEPDEPGADDVEAGLGDESLPSDGEWAPPAGDGEPAPDRGEAGGGPDGVESGVSRF